MIVNHILLGIIRINIYLLFYLYVDTFKRCNFIAITSAVYLLVCFIHNKNIYRLFDLHRL